MTALLPPLVSKWQYVEERARGVLETHGYREVHAPDGVLAAYERERREDPDRWRHEPVTRWYEMGSPRTSRIFAHVFGVDAADADAEAIAMWVALLGELSIEAPALEVTVTAGARGEDVRGRLATLGVNAGTSGGGDAAFCSELRFGSVDGPTLAAYAHATAGATPCPHRVGWLDVGAVVAAMDEPPESFEPPPALVLLPQDERGRQWALPVAARLRAAGVRLELEHRVVAAAEVRAAAKARRARLLLVVDAAELSRGKLPLEDLATGQRHGIAEDELVLRVQALLD